MCLIFFWVFEDEFNFVFSLSLSKFVFSFFKKSLTGA